MKSKKPGTEVVILAGGAGTRLWPASNEKVPKQFLRLPENQTLLEQAYRRALKLVTREHIWVVTLASYLNATRKVVPDLDPERIIAEPVGKNSGPACSVATFYIRAKLGHDATILITTADHFIPDQISYRAALRRGLRRASASSSLITFGIKPNAPKSEYGYIEVESTKVVQRVLKVRRFVEKPPLEEAKKFIRTGKHFWNSGIFAWDSRFFKTELERHAPEIYEALRYLDWKSPYILDQLAHAYTALPNISIDYALMERSTNIEVVPSRFRWSDLGTWTAVYDVSKKDREHNVTIGNGKVVDGKGNLIYAGEKPVVLFGVKDLIVVDQKEATLVTTKEASVKLKELLSKLDLSK